MYRSLLMLMLTAAFGCNPLHQRTEPATALTDMNATRSYDHGKTKETEKKGEARTLDGIVFGNQKLRTALQSVIDSNLSLVQALARLNAQKHLANGRAAGLYPQVELSGSRSKSESLMFGRTFSQDQWNASLAASYELDVFDRLGAGKKSAAYQVEASTFDLDALRISLLANFADLWWQLLEAQRAVTLLNDQEQTSESFLKVTELRFQNGLASAADVLQQRQQLSTFQTAKPQLVAQVELLEMQLAALLGEVRFPEKFRPSSEFPSANTSGHIGIPADLLTKRPDLLAARSRVAALDQDVAAAMAERLPSFRISGNIGLGALSFSELLDQWLFGLTASLALPIIDGGRRRAEVRRRKAALDEILANYRQRYIDAILDVERALVTLRQNEERNAALKDEMTTAGLLLKEARARYLDGVGQYMLVVNALQTFNEASETYSR